uniref:Uncharacterized protein n=1 Tax=Anguilla anguilla TaxID=7936 RepID=A0A0E9WTV0_ANGAN
MKETTIKRALEPWLKQVHPFPRLPSTHPRPRPFPSPTTNQNGVIAYTSGRDPESQRTTAD